MNPLIDIRWQIAGEESIPVHHQYPLLGAISRLAPIVHQSEDFGIHSIRGIRGETGRLILSRNSAVMIRTIADRIRDLLTLSGKRLQIGDSTIRLSFPEIRMLEPASSLISYLVTIKGFTEPPTFREAVRRQLDKFEVSSSVTYEPLQRRVLKIKDKSVVGFELKLGGLTDQESLLIQSRGIGGRRHLGCGLFLPSTST